MADDKKPCPNCGHCPTCGRSNAPKGYWPYPYPYTTPYIQPLTGYPITVWHQTGSTAQTGLAMSNVSSAA